MDKTFFSIYKTFFKTGTLLLGGGYVILPLLTSELSDKKGWLSSNEICEYYTISASLPGVIAINTSIFTGRKIAGLKGEIAAVCGIITPAFLAIILLATVLDEVVRLNFVKYLFWGVSIGIITLLFLAIKEMWSKCNTDKYSIGVYIITLLVALFAKISTALIIITVILYALAVQKLKSIRNNKND